MVYIENYHFLKYILVFLYDGVIAFCDTKVAWPYSVIYILVFLYVFVLKKQEILIEMSNF